MSFSKGKFGVVLFILVAMALLLLACGPKAPPPAPTPPPAPPPAGNQPPLISSLTPAATQTVPGGTVRVQCVASDPEGETPSFQWSTTAGKFDTNVGPVVTWIAPSIYGTYDITVTVSDDQGAVAQQTVTISVVANQNPNITSLVADPSAVVPGPGPGSTSVITCVASDPDDVLGPNSYSWTATDGAITGVGNKITWQAPAKEGTFYVKVTVNDGKGGTATQQVLISVGATQQTEVVNLTQGESGTVWNHGLVESRLVAGDNEARKAARAFFSFNISPLASKTVTSAKLNFTVRVITGDPFNTGPTGLGGLFVKEVRYGANPLQPAYFDVPGTSLMPAYTAPPVEINVTSQVAFLANAATNLFQVRAEFLKLNNGNPSVDSIEFATATLTVTYK